MLWPEAAKSAASLHAFLRVIPGLPGRNRLRTAVSAEDESGGIVKANYGTLLTFFDTG